MEAYYRWAEDQANARRRGLYTAKVLGGHPHGVFRAPGAIERLYRLLGRRL